MLQFGYNKTHNPRQAIINAACGDRTVFCKGDFGRIRRLPPHWKTYEGDKRTNEEHLAFVASVWPRALADIKHFAYGDAEEYAKNERKYSKLLNGE